MPISYDQLRDLAVRNADAETHPGVRAVQSLAALINNPIPYRATEEGDIDEIRSWCRATLVRIAAADLALGLGLETELEAQYMAPEQKAEAA